MTKHSETFWHAARVRFMELAERRTRDVGSLGHCEAMRELNIGHRALLRIKAHLLADGSLVDLGRNLGVAVPGVIVPTSTLAGLLRSAADRFSASASPRPGRRAPDAFEIPEHFSAAQLVKMRTAVTFLERAEHASNSSITTGPFRRHDLSGEWELLHRVESLPEFRALGVASQRAHKGAVRLLLAFAENEGLLGERPGEGSPQVLAAEWVEWIDAHRIVEGSSPTAAKARCFGLRMLARLATARGWLSIDAVDWVVVLEDIEDAWVSGIYSNAKHDKILHTYRALHRAGAVNGPSASRDRCLHVTLVDQETLHRGVDDCDYGDWRARDGTPLPRLAAELRRHHLWRSADVPTSRLRSLNPPLPSRSTTGGDRRSHAPFLLKKASLWTVSNRLMHYAGWLVLKDYARPAEVSLPGLTTLDPWELFVEESLARRGLDPVEGTNSSLSGVAQNLAVLADPYLAQEARTAGNDALATEMVERGTFFRAEALRLQPSIGEYDGAREKISAWESDGTSGYEKLGVLRRLLVDQIVALAGGQSIEEQLNQVREGTSPALVDSLEWAIAVRDYVMISILRRVPLRVANLVGLQITTAPPQRLRSGRNGHKCEWWVDDAARPWEGPITLRIAGTRSKNTKPAELPLITRDDCGARDAEADLGREVLELYLRPFGARARLLRAIDSAVDGKYILVASARHVTTDRGYGSRPWGRGSAGRRFTEIVCRSCEVLRLDRELVAATRGALGIHVIRHLFGSWFTEHGQPDFAAVMLMHSSTETLEKHYSHLTLRALSIDKRRRRIA